MRHRNCYDPSHCVVPLTSTISTYDLPGTIPDGGNQTQDLISAPVPQSTRPAAFELLYSPGWTDYKQSAPDFSRTLPLP